MHDIYIIRWVSLNEVAWRIELFQVESTSHAVTWICSYVLKLHNLWGVFILFTKVHFQSQYLSGWQTMPFLSAQWISVCHNGFLADESMNEFEALS